MDTPSRNFLEYAESIAKQYNTEINPALENNLNSIYNINKRYQLTPGTEIDFNNAVTFFYYSVLKNSKIIDNAENEFSLIFKNILMNYYERNISNTELELLFKFIYSFNKNVFDKFNLIKDSDNYNDVLINIFNEIYFLNPETLVLTENEYAHNVLMNLQKIYLKKYRNIDNEKNFEIYSYTNQEVQFLLILLYSVLYKNTNINDTSAIDNTENKYSLIYSNKLLSSYSYQNDENKNIDTPVSINSYQYSITINNPLIKDNELNLFLKQYDDKIIDTSFKFFNNNTIITKNGFNIKFYNDTVSELSWNVYCKLINNEYKLCIIENNKTYPIGTPIAITKKDYIQIDGVIINLNDIFNFLSSTNKQNYNIKISLTINNGNTIVSDGYNIFIKKSSDDANNTIEEIYNNIPILVTSDKETIKNIFSIDDVYTLYTEMLLNEENDAFNNLYTTDEIRNFYFYYYKINVDFESNTDININSEEELTELYKNEKRSYDNIESYYLDKKYNLNTLLFDNIVLKKDTSLYNAWKELYEFETSTNVSTDTYLIENIHIIYKEFNNEIRRIENANIQNKIIAKYCLENVEQQDKSRFGYSVFENLYAATDNFLLTKDEIDVFNALKTNSYIIRYGRESDLIAYLSGNIIQFGASEDTSKEVELLVKLYTETRDYYYKVLLNKAFILDEYYPIYEKLFLTAYTIERFVSSKIDNVHEIDYLNDTDCSNFLKSFGLETLNKQIDDNNFSNSLTYKKRIIAAYNDLMSQKGSKAVIDEFFKIFNYDDKNLVIFKYILLNNGKTTDATTEPVFLRLPYDATNIHYYINEYIKDADYYETFISNDKYWTKEDLPKDEIKKILVSPQNTKYLGLELTSDIYENFIKTRYSFATNKYIFESNLQNITYLESFTNIYNKIKLSGVSIDNKEYETSIILIYMYLIELFKLYIYYNEKKTSENIISNKITDKYLGINSDIIIDSTTNDNEIIKNIVSKLNLDYSIIQSIFTAPYITVGNILNTGNVEKTTFFTKSVVTEKNIYPVSTNKTTITVDCDQNVIFPKNSTAFIFKFENVTNNDIIKNKDYIELEENSRELLYTENEEEQQSYLNAIQSAFYSISLINLINNYKKATNDNNDAEKEKYRKLIISAYRLYKNSEERNKYISSSNIENDNEISILNNNFYSYIYSIILDFPLKYLHGDFQNNTGINYNKNIHDALEYIYNTFFIINNDPIGRFILQDGQTETDFPDLISTSIYDQLYSIILDDLTNIKESIKNEINIITSFISIDESINKIQSLIVYYTNILNNSIDLYENMKIKISVESDINNFFEFIKTTVAFFISYTANLYETNLVYYYNSRNEHIPLSFSINDELENTLYDYFYYDYNASIEEI